jgi:acetyltransferase-like isoleucine patch superfamily enzyme
VIGANSVVTTDLPAFSIAAGAPARVLRTISYAEHPSGGLPPDAPVAG